MSVATGRLDRRTQGDSVTLTSTIPTAVHLGADDVPFVQVGDGSLFKVLKVDVVQGLWIVENVFQAGFTAPTHRHTGPVYGYTTAGAWRYTEYEDVNRKGSFLFEPAGSLHTLQCIEPDTRVWFQVYGANLNVGEDGAIESVTDGSTVLANYYRRCEEQGLPRPNVLVS